MDKGKGELGLIQKNGWSCAKGVQSLQYIDLSTKISKALTGHSTLASPELRDNLDKEGQEGWKEGELCLGVKLITHLRKSLFCIEFSTERQEM